MNPSLTSAHLDRANETLSASPTRQQLPRIAHRRHSSAVLLIAGLAVVPLLPPRPLTAAQIPEPGSEQIRIEKLNGLEPVLTLDQIEGRDEAQAKRLKQLRKQAKDLERRLQNGMSKRQALSEIAKLRDAIAREQRQLGSTKERAGLEDALKQMQDEPLLDEARQALGDRNMTRFDEQMQRLANRLEKRQERALKALERLGVQLKNAMHKRWPRRLSVKNKH